MTVGDDRMPIMALASILMKTGQSQQPHTAIFGGRPPWHQQCSSVEDMQMTKLLWKLTQRPNLVNTKTSAPKRKRVSLLLLMPRRAVTLTNVDGPSCCGLQGIRTTDIAKSCRLHLVHHQLGPRWPTVALKVLKLEMDIAATCAGRPRLLECCQLQTAQVMMARR